MISTQIDMSFNRHFRAYQQRDTHFFGLLFICCKRKFSNLLSSRITLDTPLRMVVNKKCVIGILVAVALW